MLQKLGKVLALFTPEQPELSVREIARVFRWPKSTAYRILSRIEASGFLDRDEHSGAYRLGIRLAAYGELARHSTSLQRVVSPWLRKLSDATSETATLMLYNGTEGVTVDVVESFQPLMLPGLLGGSMPLHATAGGKALLAWAPPGHRELGYDGGRRDGCGIISVRGARLSWAAAAGLPACPQWAPVTARGEARGDQRASHQWTERCWRAADPARERGVQRTYEDAAHSRRQGAQCGAEDHFETSNNSGLSATLVLMSA